MKNNILSNMKSRNGQTTAELIIVVLMIAIVIGVIVGFCNKFVFGNKQLVDFKQNFNTAYIMDSSNCFKRVSIKAWKDWEDSDAIQVILEDGTAIYTHLSNVKLASESR